MVIGCLCLSVFTVETSGVGQEFVPPDHWAYGALERFETLGLCNVPEDAPFTRPEFIKLVSEIAENAFDRRLSPRDRFQLERLEKEFTEFESQRNPQARWDPPTFYLWFQAPNNINPGSHIHGVPWSQLAVPVQETTSMPCHRTGKLGTCILKKLGPNSRIKILSCKLWD